MNKRNGWCHIDFTVSTNTFILYIVGDMQEKKIEYEYFEYKCMEVRYGIKITKRTTKKYFIYIL